MNFIKLQLNMKACTLPDIFKGAWFDAFQLDAHDVIFNRKTIFAVHETHIQLWQIEADLSIASIIPTVGFNLIKKTIQHFFPVVI